jgi:hypothetical protein
MLVTEAFLEAGGTGQPGFHGQITVRGGLKSSATTWSGRSPMRPAT